jgi:4-hydroxybenzoate polyprenyltransferase/phosphoserine phosphatase
VNEIPLCVDLDGTFLQTDTLHEGIILLAKRRPLFLLALPFWWMRGRAHLKREVTKRVDFDIGTLPVNRAFLDYLEKERNGGRRIVLVTAADESLAHAVSRHFPIFEGGVLSSDGTSNLSGKEKADVLKDRFGKSNFDYAGNAWVDLPVWAAARHAIVVNADSRTLREARKIATIETVFDRTPKNRIVAFWRALRVHQWSKNVLLFIPLLGAHKWNDPQKIKFVLLGFVSFCLCASSVYVLNDLLDLTSDRRHPRKRLRVFASAALPIGAGVFMAPLLLLAALSIAVFLPLGFLVVFALYYVLTLSYSLCLKQIELIDVFVLTSLYGLRILAGGFAGTVEVSNWLLVLSLFLFLSLAFAKRFTELRSARLRNHTEIAGRGYSPADDETVNQMGVASGYIAVVILALYVTNPIVTELYLRPLNLLLACPLLLYWISRVWLLARRGELHEDPVVFAFTDRQSWVIALGLMLVVMASGPR